MRSATKVYKKRANTTTTTRATDNNTSNGTTTEPHTLTIPSSSSDSQTNQQPSHSDFDSGDEAKASDISNQHTTDKSRVKNEEDGRNASFKKKEKALYRFPMDRIKRIVRSESSDDVRLTQEAVFLINKASEKFVQLFCEKAYAGSVRDHKNYVAYKHLSSVVGKRRRFDFLSDIVPEKLKAEDALKERESAGT